jgi:hypothetical protein
VGILLCRDKKASSSLYSITLLIQIVTIWLCVCISGWKMGEKGEVRVGVLLCRDKKASFICVRLYTLDPNSYYQAVCVYQWQEAGGERGG